MAVLQNHVDNAVRDVYVYYGTGGNIHCRKENPCSTRASGSMYPRPACLRFALKTLRVPPAVKDSFNTILQQNGSDYKEALIYPQNKPTSCPKRQKLLWKMHTNSFI